MRWRRRGRHYAFHGRRRNTNARSYCNAITDVVAHGTALVIAYRIADAVGNC
jgi:hypothetical protein